MQGSNTGTSRLVKKQKLANDDTVPTNGSFKKPAADGSTIETPLEPYGELPSEIPTNASATNTPATSESTVDKSSVDCPETVEDLDLQGTDDLPTSTTHIHIKGDKAVDNMSPTTHRAGYDILNEFFGQSAIDPKPVSDIERPCKWPASTAEYNHRPEVLEHTARSNTPEAVDAPQNLLGSGINAVSSTTLHILDPDLFIASAATSEPGSRGLSEPRSLSTDLTSYTPSKTYTYSDLASGLQHTAYVKCSILDHPTPWLEHVLTALETDDTSRKPNSVPGILDDILTKGDFALCVKIMTSIAENWVKCNRYIAKPEFDAV